MMKINKIIITRPEPFASQLTEKLKAVGFKQIVCLPCLQINALPLPQTTPPVDLSIFISRNAVIYGHPLIQTEQIAAIGVGTKIELERYQKIVKIFPSHPPFNSEALLSLPELINVKHKKIRIIRGGAGRSLLADTLAARGADISFIDVYSRQQVNYSAEILQTIFNNNEQCLVICTSNELLKNFIGLTKKATIDSSKLQLLVISSIMSDEVSKADFMKPAIIAASPNDEDIIWTLRLLKNQKEH